MSKAIVNKKINFKNDIYYYNNAYVVGKITDNFDKHYSKTYYPYINFKSDSYVKTTLSPIIEENRLWKSNAISLSSYELNDFDKVSTLEFLRLNSNIYKNIFPEEIFNMDYLNKSMANTIISTEDIKQDNHNLSINDFVYLDDDGLYKKALAEESTRANVKGIVTKIAGPNVFTLMDSGKIEFDHLDYNDTSVLYLSDKIPGKAVHYTEITNTIYIPVAIYIENNIIINLQQGSIGDVLAPYEEEKQSFEIYTEQDLNDIINQLVNGVK